MQPLVTLDRRVGHPLRLRADALGIVRDAVRKRIHVVAVRDRIGAVPVVGEQHFALCKRAYVPRVQLELRRQLPLRLPVIEVADHHQRDDRVVELPVNIRRVLGHLTDLPLALQTGELFDVPRLQLRRKQRLAEHLLRKLELKLEGRDMVGDLKGQRRGGAFPVRHKPHPFSAQA